MSISFVSGTGNRLALLVLVLAAVGCGSEYSAAAHRVDPESARSTLVAVLDSWKSGEKPDAWQQKSPSVVIQDFDWMGGAKLTSYEIVTTKAIDANLHCEVKLSLTDPQSRDSEKTVTYLVSTSPVLTVFRAAGP
jgi:hypothetical protein